MKPMCVPLTEVERLMKAKDDVAARLSLQVEQLLGELGGHPDVTALEDQIRLKDAAIVALTDELTRLRAWVAKEDQ